mmetsp:Transcript_3643/g.12293  ORF Transcript_3643/g.12293 Transcript_3643/m.12293 type:complete len:308 (+) Transcript_3643:574-1497(+)
MSVSAAGDSPAAISATDLPSPASSPAVSPTSFAGAASTSSSVTGAAAITPPSPKSVSSGSNPRAVTACLYASIWLLLFRNSHPVCSARAFFSSVSASPSTVCLYALRTPLPPSPNTYVVNSSTPFVKRSVSSRSSSHRVTARNTLLRTLLSCSAKSSLMASAYFSIADPTPVAAVTSADALALSLSRISSAALKSNSETCKGVFSFNRIPSPDLLPVLLVPLVPPPPRKLNTYSSSSSKPESAKLVPFFLAASASFALTGITAGSVTPNNRSAFSTTNCLTSFISPAFSSRSHLFTMNTTFLPHFLM